MLYNLFLLFLNIVGIKYLIRRRTKSKIRCSIPARSFYSALENISKLDKKVIEQSISEYNAKQGVQGVWPMKDRVLILCPDTVQSSVLVGDLVEPAVEDSKIYIQSAPPLMVPPYSLHGAHRETEFQVIVLCQVDSSKQVKRQYFLCIDNRALVNILDEDFFQPIEDKFNIQYHFNNYRQSLDDLIKSDPLCRGMFQILNFQILSEALLKLTK